jgi:hypothetical protein
VKIDRGNFRTLLVGVGCLVAQPTRASLALGWAVLVAGCALHLWSKGCLRQDLELTTSGPYRWTRNPFYLANLVIDAGLCVVIARWWLPLLVLPAWWIVYRPRILDEERRLAEIFGDPYRRYAAALPRLLPALRPLPAPVAGPTFSWRNSNLAAGKEYGRLLGILLVPGVIWLVRRIWEAGIGVLASFDSAELPLVLLMCGLAFVRLALIRKLEARSRRVVARSPGRPAENGRA